MTCLACRTRTGGFLCRPCTATLGPTPDRMAGPVLVRSAFAHEGAARSLVHRLKYEAVAGVADALAGVVAPLLPADTPALVPVPRAVARRLRYGIDPARALAAAVSARTGIPVRAVLVAPWWVHRRAGPAGSRRGAPRFQIQTVPPPGSVLVDDVVTSGATLVAASRATGCTRAVTVTAGHSTLSRGRPVP